MAARDNPPPWATPTVNPVLDWIRGKRAEDLAIVEHGGRRYYPDTIKRRRKDDPEDLEVVPVLIRTPTTQDKALARLDALAWCHRLASEQGRRDLPKGLAIKEAEALFGPAYFDELDTKCIVARCTHQVDPPHEQYLLPWILDARHDHGSIMDLWDRICFWHDFTDVRVQELTEDQFLEVVAAIDRVGNVSPLVAFAGATRDACVRTMARQLASYRTARS